MNIVQLATPTQGVDVEELAQQHHDEFGGSREFDVTAVAQACFLCVADKERKHVNCWIAYNDDKPIGYIAGTIRPSFYSHRTYAVQEMWFVLQEFRGSLAAIALLKTFERWARERGVERIYTQVEHDDDVLLVERTLQLMRRLGYRKQGYIAVKVLDNHKHEDDNDDRTAHREVGAGQAAS